MNREGGLRRDGYSRQYGHSLTRSTATGAILYLHSLPRFLRLPLRVAAGIATADSHLGSWARIVTLIIGLIGATAVAIEKVMRNGPRWRLYRSSYENLAAEGWAFFNNAEQYEKLDKGKRFSLFFEKVEKILASRGQRYFVEIASLDNSGAHKGT
jgi:hypothetical protein